LNEDGRSVSNLQITKLGIIKGGNCEKWFKARSNREVGVRMAIDWLLNHNCININKGMCKIVKVPTKLHSLKWVINFCNSSDIEIGWRRFISEIAIPLYKKGKEFKLTQLKKWGADKAALEFALMASIKNYEMIYSVPHRDELYKKWKPLENK